MTVPAITAAPVAPRRTFDRLADRGLFGLTVLASITSVVVIIAVIYKVVDGASLAINTYGLSFVGHTSWVPNALAGHPNGFFGAGAFLYGTLVSSAMALILAVPIGVAIGLFLSLLASRRTAAVVGPLVEMLAAIPSVVLGLWGIIFLAPFLRSTIEPALHDVLGFVPIFGTPSTTGLGLFTAGLILTIMVIPIIASISRELFTSVPDDLKDGALALGMTRWEMVRGVVLSSTRPGLSAAAILGLSRALGEAIAVTQVIGGGSEAGGALINTNFFSNADTIGSRIASQFSDSTGLFTSSLFYLAVILLVIELIVNLAAQLIVRRYERATLGAR
jgi:phosphate transport system permease protein